MTTPPTSVGSASGRPAADGRTTGRAGTRAALAEAAVRLIAERGWRGTTVEDIADEVGVTSRTFFRHFSSKEAALFTRQEETGRRLAAALAARPEDEDPVLGLRAALVETAEFVDEQGRWMLGLAQVAREVPAVADFLQANAHSTLHDVVLAWAERRLQAPALVDPRPALLAGVATTCVLSAMQRWLAHAGGLRLADLVPEHVDAVADLLEPLLDGRA